MEDRLSGVRVEAEGLVPALSKLVTMMAQGRLVDTLAIQEISKLRRLFGVNASSA